MMLTKKENNTAINQYKNLLMHGGGGGGGAGGEGEREYWDLHGGGGSE